METLLDRAHALRGSFPANVAARWMYDAEAQAVLTFRSSTASNAGGARPLPKTPCIAIQGTFPCSRGHLSRDLRHLFPHRGSQSHDLKHATNKQCRVS